MAKSVSELAMSGSNACYRRPRKILGRPRRALRKREASSQFRGSGNPPRSGQAVEDRLYRPQYRDHATELGNEVPKEPLLFLKAPSSILPPGGTIHIPTQSERVDFEGELAIVMRKRASRLGPDDDVKPYIRGYTIVNDVTARDLQKSDGQWSRAKGFDTFCPVGPIVTDEIDPDAGLSVETRLNGVVRQQGNTLDLIFPIAHLLRYISAAMTLMPGDLIPTGTPAGVAPMQPGDLVEVAIQGIGRLHNSVSASNP